MEKGIVNYSVNLLYVEIKIFIFGLVANITENSTSFFMLLWHIIFNFIFGHKILSQTSIMGIESHNIEK